MRVVADTNVLISGLLWRGAPRDLLLAAEAGRLDLITSTDLRREVAGVLRRTKFRTRIHSQSVNIGRLLANLDTRLTIIECPPLSKPVIVNDPDDDAVLACALTARADAIVSGDSDLLTLQTYKGIPILGVGELLGRVGLK